MAILNLGSINIDRMFRLPALPLPGETVSAEAEHIGLGGKGANQSVAIARSGGKVKHLGAIAQDDTWIIDQLRASGVDVAHIHLRNDTPSGQAVVMVSNDGENSILLSAGANASLKHADIDAALAGMAPGDWLLFQNETNSIAHAARSARAKGLKVAFAAAPFAAPDVLPLLPSIDLLALNGIEYRQLCEAGFEPGGDNGPALLVTAGARGATYTVGASVYNVPSFPVTVQDTTAAGDTFLGAFLAELDRTTAPETALRFASAAAALKVTRRGAAEAIPYRQAVENFLRTNGNGA